MAIENNGYRPIKFTLQTYVRMDLLLNNKRPKPLNNFADFCGPHINLSF